MLDDTDTKIIVSDLNNVSEKYNDQEIIQISDIDFNITASNPDIEIYPNYNSYIIYTSGSTGIPKGVIVNHQNLSSLIKWGIDTFSSHIFDGMLLSTSMNFDVSVFELFVTLSAGGSVILVDNILEIFNSKYLRER